MRSAKADPLASLREQARLATDGLGLAARDVEVVSHSGRERKRGPGGGPLLRMALVERDGVLDWVVSDASRRAGGGRKRGRRRDAGAGAGDAVEVHAFEFERIPPSRVTAALDALDARLTPPRGLRRWHGGTLAPVAAPSATRGSRALLIVHGTFSRGEAITEQLEKAPGGRALLGRWADRYAEVLTFDHPTLAVSPFLNAYDLERAIGGCEATFDVVAHSRGGLVARAWADGFRGGTRGVGRLVLVGTPLAGTSLAAPHRLQEAMRYLTNVGRVVGGLAGLGAANPFLAAAAGVMQVLTSLGMALAGTPLLDAAVALVPGLAAQSRVGNAPEILRLRHSTALDPARVAVVRADFEPEDVHWDFLKLFTQAGTRLADLGADLLFPGPNDLVVDTESIASLADGVEVPAERRLDFGRQGRVHHCNYFLQPETVRFLGDTLTGA